MPTLVDCNSCSAPIRSSKSKQARLARANNHIKPNLLVSYNIQYVAATSQKPLRKHASREREQKASKQTNENESLFPSVPPYPPSLPPSFSTSRVPRAKHRPVCCSLRLLLLPLLLLQLLSSSRIEPRALRRDERHRAGRRGARTPWRPAASRAEAKSPQGREST